MKLTSLNIEGYRHSSEVEAFLKKENADVICLMECPVEYVSTIESIGYHCTFAPVHLVKQDEMLETQCVLLGTKTSHTAEKFYYYKYDKTKLIAEQYDKDLERNTNDAAAIIATFALDNIEYTIGTTHFTWAQHGDTPNRGQKEDMVSFLEYVKKLPSHVMCGDFNIPRHHNYLYENLLEVYTDAIPKKYKSSLDKSLHRKGSDKTRAIMFTNYMVDYVFTQPPYKAENVRLEFGISDHAAVVADIYKE